MPTWVEKSFFLRCVVKRSFFCHVVLEKTFLSGYEGSEVNFLMVRRVGKAFF